MARDARRERFRSGGVLLLVAGGAGLDDRLAAGRVASHHVFVAVGARSGDWLVIFVRAVAVEAFFGIVNFYGRRRALGGQVAVRAIAGGVRVRGESLAARQRLERIDRGVLGEAVAKHAVALARAAETRSSFAGRVRKL